MSVARCGPAASVSRRESKASLDIPDRTAILRVLDDCPEDMGELRATLLQGARGAEAGGARLAHLPSRLPHLPWPMGEPGTTFVLWWNHTPVCGKRYTRYVADGDDGGEGAS